MLPAQTVTGDDVQGLMVRDLDHECAIVAMARIAAHPAVQDAKFFRDVEHFLQFLWVLTKVFNMATNKSNGIGSAGL